MPKTRSFPAIAVTVVVLLATTASGATANATRPTKTAPIVISTRKVGKLGTVLVNANGLTLYMFVPDKRKHVTCVSTCAVIWPPVKLPTGAKTLAKGQAKTKLLGSDRDPAGGRVVTYDGWPLYTYITDKKPGTATGQAINLNGGLWYALAPTGKIIKTKITA